MKKASPALVVLGFLALAIGSCRDTGVNSEITVNSFSDSTLVKVAEFADKRDTHSLAAYFTNPNSKYRRQAALAMASVADSASAMILIPGLSDSIAVVREAGAYAAGQCHNNELLRPLIILLSTEKNSSVRAAAIEAVGKLTDQQHLEVLYHFDPANQEEKMGWARSVFWAHYRALYHPLLEERIMYQLQDADHDCRVVLAAALSRADADWLEEQETYLTNWLNQEHDPELRAILISAMGKIHPAGSLKLIVGLACTESLDDAPRVAALRALAKFPAFDPSSVLPCLASSSYKVVEEALILLSKLDENKLKGLATASLKSLVGHEPELAAQALRLRTRMGEAELTDWQVAIDSCADDFSRAFFVRLAGGCNSPEIFRGIVLPNLQQVASPVLSSAAAEALAEYADKAGADELQEILHLIHGAFDLGDPGTIATLAAVLRDEKIFDPKDIGDRSWIHQAQDKLSLPREIETYNELLLTLNKLEGSSIPPKVLEYNHPIDWELVRSLPSEVVAVIHTTAGDIVLNLNTDEAPGSVSNFVSLARQGFYTGKYFHRVVNNFVIQAGCPRGDGWGSTDYTIRSEFGVHDYRGGAIGMASAGHDTESCQWFITHNRTPHLEGRYTIFGYVTEGMDVVNRVHMGDRIESIEIR